MGLEPAFRQIIATFRNSSAWNQDLDLRLLQALWPQVAGLRIASNTSVGAIHGQRMIVRVPDETWTHALAAVRPALILKMNSMLPGSWIRGIQFTHEDHYR